MQLSRRFGMIVIAVSVIFFASLGMRGYAEASTPMTICTGLTAQLSSDKNYYIFTAHAIASSGVTITGYTFDFGDHQSYSVTFDSTVSRNRSQAAAAHTYELNGDYTASVSVLALMQSQARAVSSPACFVHVVSGSSANDLVNTGSSGLSLFIGAAIAGTGLHYSLRWWRHSFGFTRLGLWHL